MKKRHIALAAVTLAGSAAVIPTAVDARQGGSRTDTYRITIENLAPAGSQPLSPAGVVVHRRSTDVWSVGEPASAAVAAVAEDANLGVFVDTYDDARGVRLAAVAGEGPIAPGQSTSFEFEAKPNNVVSVVSMLVNTNDAFTGLDSVRLSRRTQTIYAGAYDAGTEVNNEDPAFIPGPAGENPFVRSPEGEVITPHDGLVGQPGGIDPAVYGWDDPVAKITIERMP